MLSLILTTTRPLFIIIIIVGNSRSLPHPPLSNIFYRFSRVCAASLRLTIIVLVRRWPPPPLPLFPLLTIAHHRRLIIEEEVEKLKTDDSELCVVTASCVCVFHWGVCLQSASEVLFLFLECDLFLCFVLDYLPFRLFLISTSLSPFILGPR